MDLDPTTTRLSKHFLLSDFLGNHTVYTRGLPNMLDPHDPQLPLKMRNGRALAEQLEVLLDQFGPLSISYGYIAPEVSDVIVTYQDPRKPSHHLWNLGAACDINVHNWTYNESPDTDTAATSPIALAHAIHNLAIPYSRLLTYSESPYICFAVSAEEVKASTPRLALYENRFTGRAKTKPDYRQYSTSQAKARAQRLLDEGGLEHGWKGGGYPSYHGGGRRQGQHIRTGKYTVLSDWLFDMQSIANGYKNAAQIGNRPTWEALCAAADAYDAIIDGCFIRRLSIIEAYLNPTNPNFSETRDWRRDQIVFYVRLPEDSGLTADDIDYVLEQNPNVAATATQITADEIAITVQVR